ncbi:MAG: fibronectin type III domain-containing protein [Cytophagales bacterium]|nr:fibronectin type III domain-containing protein [Cytophagales bacterium]
MLWSPCLQAIGQWNDNSTGEDAFVLQRKIGTSSFEDLDIVRAGVTSYSDSLLTPATAYTYRVKSTNAAGQSAFSNEFTVTTLDAPPAPGAPTDLAVQFDNEIYIFQ